MKIFFRRIHLYLGLVSGLVVAVVCLTGSILVFEKELEQAFHPERYFVEAVAERLPINTLAAHAQAARPGLAVTAAKVYADPRRSVELAVSAPEKEKPKGRVKQPDSPGRKPEKAKEKKGGSRRTLFLNPYTGALLDDYSYRGSFFHTVMSIHRGMVAGDAGKLIIGVNAIFFLCIVITGLVLWWPATRNALKARLRLKTDASWKRLNHDLHVVLGFYFSIVLGISAFTGLAWSFEWFNDAIYWVTRSEKRRPEPPRSVLLGADSTKTIGFDAGLAVARRLEPEAVSWSVQIPPEKDGSITLTVLRPNQPHAGATDEYMLERYTGRQLARTLYEERNLGQRVRGSFKPVHTWGYLGWPGKAVGFLACLFGFTAPFTGLILWLNRTRKKKGRVRKAARAHGAVQESSVHRARRMANP